MSKQLIVTFHGIGVPHASAESSENPYWVPFDAMRQIFLRIAELKKFENSSPEIIITFDDGNISDLTLALPELVKLNLKAKFFVCPGRVNDPNYLNRSAIRTLHDEGMTIGNHGMFQRNLTKLTEKQLEVEILAAGDQLSEFVGTHVTEFAVPFGAYNRKVLRWLDSHPISQIYTSDRGHTLSCRKIKCRETITYEMAQRDMPDALLKPLGLGKYLRHSLAGIYKRWR